MLTLAIADRLAAAAIDAARARGVATAAAVVDAGGHLLAFRRDDGALFLTAVVAPRKAWTAAAAGLPTDRWNDLAADPRVAPIVHDTGLLAVAGGVPIAIDGHVVGGIGVSGGSAAQDGSIALEALAALT